MTIQELQHHINIYQKRYKSNQESFRKRQSKLKNKIYRWKESLKEQIKQRDALKEMEKKIKCDVGKSIKAKNGVNNEISYSFYKLALEKGIKSKNIATFVGVKNTNTIDKGRKEVFKNPKKKQIYDNLKKAVE